MIFCSLFLFLVTVVTTPFSLRSVLPAFLSTVCLSLLLSILPLCVVPLVLSCCLFLLSACRRIGVSSSGVVVARSFVHRRVVSSQCRARMRALSCAILLITQCERTFPLYTAEEQWGEPNANGSLLSAPMRSGIRSARQWDWISFLPFPCSLPLLSAI